MASFCPEKGVRTEFLCFCASDKIFTMGGKCQKVQMLLPFCQFSNSFLSKDPYLNSSNKFSINKFFSDKFFVCKITHSLFDKSLLRTFGGEYGSVTAPLVLLVLNNAIYKNIIPFAKPKELKNGKKYRETKLCPAQ